MYCKLICVAPNGLEKTSPKAMQCHTHQQSIHMCNNQSDNLGFCHLDNLGFLPGLSLSGRCYEIGHIRIVQFQKISILPPQKGMEFPGGWGGSLRPKNLKKCTKLNWNFQRGGWGVLEKIPSVGEVWIFSGITQYWTHEGNTNVLAWRHCTCFGAEFKSAYKWVNEIAKILRNQNRMRILGNRC